MLHLVGDLMIVGSPISMIPYKRYTIGHEIPLVATSGKILCGADTGVKMQVVALDVILYPFPERRVLLTLNIRKIMMIFRFFLSTGQIEIQIRLHF